MCAMKQSLAYAARKYASLSFPTFLLTQNNTATVGYMLTFGPPYKSCFNKVFKEKEEEED